MSKDKLKELRALKEMRTKKHKGAKPGSRNAPVTDTLAGGSDKKPQDKRVGSKKPVPLVIEPQETQIELKRHLKPQVELKTVSMPELTPEQELAELEQDERLLKLVERHEQGELLKGKDAKYFNAKIARHQVLCELLGIEDDEFEEDEFEQADDYSAFLNNDLADEWLNDDDEDER